MLFLMIPVFVAMRVITRHDDQRLAQYALRLRMVPASAQPPVLGCACLCAGPPEEEGVTCMPIRNYSPSRTGKWRLLTIIPYSTHVTDQVIRTREGDYLRVWKIAGIAFEAADPADILARHEGFNQLVRGLAGGHVALWSHRLRRRVSDHFATPYGNRFCQELATRYYASFAGYRMMANELYLSSSTGRTGRDSGASSAGPRAARATTSGATSTRH